MAIDRRALLALAGGGLASLTPLSQSMASGMSDQYLGVQRHNTDGTFVAVISDATGKVVRDIPLPGRAHGITVRSGTRQAVAMARRPGRFAVVFDLVGDAPPVEFNSPMNRHFQGHAVFDATNRYLFTTENDFDGERGVIGIYDASDRYRRIGEFPSHGVGTHQLARIPNSDTLVVCNGGILTHPDSGRAKLNIPFMEPSLSYIDSHTGILLDQYTPTEDRRRKLSIRHLDLLPNGQTVFACQDQIMTTEALPLVALHRPGSSNVTHLPAPDTVHRAMAGYCGSIRTDRSGQVIAVSAPRGNIVVFWDTATTRLIGTLSLPDGCGIAPGQRDKSFVLSSGNGAFVEYNPLNPAPVSTGLSISDPWDNHLSEM